MKWRRLIISAAALLTVAHVSAGDSLDVSQYHYEQYVQRVQNIWASLIPTHFVIQNAGNMGVLSAGIGWSYGVTATGRPTCSSATCPSTTPLAAS